MISDRPPSPTASWLEISAGLEQFSSRLARFSPAEQVVARYLGEGLTNREIAALLGKSEATVKNQVSACLRKCGVPTRSRFIALMR